MFKMKTQFLLLFFISGGQLSRNSQVKIAIKGRDATLPRPSRTVDYSVLYRLSGEGDLLLVDCSQRHRPPPDGYEVECSGRGSVVMKNLTMSQTGHYRFEDWRKRNVIQHRSFRLIVCEEGTDAEEKVAYDNSVVLCRFDSSLGNGSSLQLYRDGQHNMALVLDTNSSLNPLLEGLKGRLRVDSENSRVTLSGITCYDSDYYCTTWRGGQCLSSNHRDLEIVTKKLFAYEGDNVTLPCVYKEDPPGRVHWLVSDSDQDGWFRVNQTHGQEGMCMLNGSLTGDYSLIISSLSRQHSKTYQCLGPDHLIKRNALYVCTRFSPLGQMFSHSEQVILEYSVTTVKFKPAHGMQWFRQKVPETKVLIRDAHNKSVSFPEDLRDRVTVTDPDYYLNITNTSAEDSGVYTWRVYGEVKEKVGNYNIVCFEGAIHLQYRAQHELVWPLNRVCVCGLLGLVAAVIWCKQRNQGRNQTTGHQIRGGQSSGSEDISMSAVGYSSV